jgi:uncharacterized membrane protein
LKWKKGIAFVSGLKLVATGIILELFTINSGALIWLGLQPINFSTVDYFPLLPWFGVVLIGLYFGKLLYAGGQRTFALKHELSKKNPICFLGRHSLLIYLIHQPIFIAILYFLLGIKIF